MEKMEKVQEDKEKERENRACDEGRWWDCVR